MSSIIINILTGQHQIWISSIYKSPNQIMDSSNLEKLTSGCDSFVATGDSNAKHPLWHSHYVNPASNILYNHAQTSDYSIISPDTQNVSLSNSKNRPDVLDIALIKLPLHTVENSNLNYLSSDYIPILLTISKSPITTYPTSI